MISTQAATLVILGMLGLVVNHVFACIWYYIGADDFSEECSTADVPARACTWMQVHGLHPHRTVWNSPPRRVDPRLKFDFRTGTGGIGTSTLRVCTGRS